MKKQDKQRLTELRNDIVMTESNGDRDFYEVYSEFLAVYLIAKNGRDVVKRKQKLKFPRWSQLDNDTGLNA